MVKPQENKMKTIRDYLNAIRDRYGLDPKNKMSDYRLAQLLGITRQSISQYRSGKTKYFSEETAYQIARLLSIDPEEVLLSQAIERAGNKEVKDTWQRILTRISKHAAGIAFVAFSAAEFLIHYTVYYVKFSSNIFMSRFGMKPA